MALPIQAKNGDMNGAAATIQRALKATETIQNAYSKALAFVPIATTQAKNGDMDGGCCNYSEGS